MWDQLKDVLPQDHARQVTAEYYLRQLAGKLAPGATIVDLGCGAGGSVDVVRALAPTARWLGVDIESSPEVNARKRSDAEFLTYDGIHLPFDDASVDLVYSKQVLEHVRHPEALLRSVRRVLRAGASFVGSTSHLEPYHSFSYWNFTPYGMRVLLEDAGFRLKEMRPGIDGVTLTQRTLLGRPKSMGRWFTEESPVNQEIETAGANNQLTVGQIAIRKLAVCGHFAFWAVAA